LPVPVEAAELLFREVLQAGAQEACLEAAAAVAAGRLQVAQQALAAQGAMALSLWSQNE
jgi:hypothetical protein